MLIFAVCRKPGSPGPMSFILRGGTQQAAEWNGVGFANFKFPQTQKLYSLLPGISKDCKPEDRMSWWECCSVAEKRDFQEKLDRVMSSTSTHGPRLVLSDFSDPPKQQRHGEHHGWSALLWH